MASAAMLAVACGNEVESRGNRPRRGWSDIATNLDVPWGIAFLPDGSALIAERDSAADQTPDGAWCRDSTSVGRRRRRPRRRRPAGSGHLGADRLRVPHDGQDNRVVRMNFEGAALSGHRRSYRHSRGNRPRRWAHRARAGWQAVCGDGRDRRPAVGTGPILVGRQDSPDQSRRVHPARTIPIRHRRSGRSGTATSRAWRGMPAAGCGPPSTARIGLDELNLIQPGGNYGWPMAEGRSDTEGLVDPLIQWRTDDASPSGLAYFGGSLWVAASSRRAAVSDSGRGRRCIGSAIAAVRRTIRPAAHGRRRSRRNACGSPPATATAGEIRATAMTGSFSSGLDASDHLVPGQPPHDRPADEHRQPRVSTR